MNTHPVAFKWFTGSPYTLPKSKVLVRAACGADFWTWIDQNGERVWDIVRVPAVMVKRVQLTEVIEPQELGGM